MAPRVTTSELLIRQRVRALARSLPGAQEGDAARLHEARVATRRLREALPLVMPGPRGRKLQRTVRRLTRALGPVRELDVALHHLAELEAAREVPAASLASLKDVIRRERKRLHADMCREVARVDLDKVRRRVAAAARKGRLAPSGGRVRDPKRLVRARNRAARRAGRLRTAIVNAAGIYLPDRLHEVRIGIKKLRYALELARELTGSRATAGIRALKDAQDLLGRMRDLEVLIARVRAIQGSGKPNLRLSADLDRLVRRLETECRQLHSQYMTLRKRLLAICDRTETSAAGRSRSGSPASSAA